MSNCSLVPGEQIKDVFNTDSIKSSEFMALALNCSRGAARSGWRKS